jgi:hypothetical protein
MRLRRKRGKEMSELTDVVEMLQTGVAAAKDAVNDLAHVLSVAEDVLSRVEDVNTGSVVHVGEDIVHAVDDLAAKVHALVDPSHNDTAAPTPVSHVKVL